MRAVLKALRGISSSRANPVAGGFFLSHFKNGIAISIAITARRGGRRPGRHGIYNADATGAPRGGKSKSGAAAGGEAGIAVRASW